MVAKVPYFWAKRQLLESVISGRSFLVRASSIITSAFLEKANWILGNKNSVVQLITYTEQTIKLSFLQTGTKREVRLDSSDFGLEDLTCCSARFERSLIAGELYRRCLIRKWILSTTWMNGVVGMRTKLAHIITFMALTYPSKYRKWLKGRWSELYRWSASGQWLSWGKLMGSNTCQSDARKTFEVSNLVYQNSVRLWILSNNTLLAYLLSKVEQVWLIPRSRSQVWLRVTILTEAPGATTRFVSSSPKAANITNLDECLLA